MADPAALGPGARIERRTPHPYASSFPLERLDVVLDGARLDVLWKDLTPSSLLPGARLARGGVVPDPSHELRAYDLLSRCDLGTPRRIAAVHDEGRAWLFLELIEGERLDEVGDPAAWATVARWLPRAHAQLTAAAAGDPSFPPPWRPPSLDALPPELAALAAAARERAAALPAAVIHGELYPANVLVAPDRVAVLDWETIARGPALLDLATLTAGAWDDPDEPLAHAYREALPDPPPFAAVRAGLDACRLLVAAHRLAAPPDWRPPDAQARDWRADAELVAARLAR